MSPAAPQSSGAHVGCDADILAWVTPSDITGCRATQAHASMPVKNVVSKSLS